MIELRHEESPLNEKVVSGRHGNLDKTPCFIHFWIGHVSNMKETTRNAGKFEVFRGFARRHVRNVRTDRISQEKTDLARVSMGATSTTGFAFGQCVSIQTQI